MVQKMAELKHDYSEYTKGVIKITVAFPPENVCCQWCPLLRYEHGIDRAYCSATREFIQDFKTQIGRECPMQITEVAK